MFSMIDSVKSSVSERFSSPLTGSFIVSWLLWNYKFIFVMFSDMKIHVKFSYIQNHIWTTPLDIGVLCFLGPIGTALLYLYLYPIPAKRVHKYWLREQNELRKQRQEADEVSPHTHLEWVRVRKELKVQVAELQTDLDSRDDIIDTLRADVDKLQRQLLDSQESVRERDVSLDLIAKDATENKKVINRLRGSNEQILQNNSSLADETARLKDELDIAEQKITSLTEAKLKAEKFAESLMSHRSKKASSQSHLPISDQAKAAAELAKFSSHTSALLAELKQQELEAKKQMEIVANEQRFDRQRYLKEVGLAHPGTSIAALERARTDFETSRLEANKFSERKPTDE
ncbi:hypothetical protein IB229_12940 [Pseudomonas sp. PDM14]|uniref:coiled-coil domain-containing protein n=1 Tax=Pseudomonas sp. PDM14 TaxID=2769288 RepID=UPI00178042EA|nr:hypothetical protein [Pseudomonas sp. PDM14]MBD9483885.1 hypothetical protein [Pseudomonas sp. PDM14]